MNIAEFSIRNKLISWLITIILLVGGILSFTGLSQLEDPEFTIKDAVITTQYPGASPQQVEEEVTYPLENAIQQLPYVDYIRSVSTTGLSQITVTMKRQYNKNHLPQIWDELRRKVNDLAPSLPPGVLAPLVNDDFGDIFGLLYAVIGDGYSYRELNDYVDYLRRELVLVEGVGKVSVAGKQQEQVFVEISLSRMTRLGIPYQRIYDILANQNIVSNAGAIQVSSESIRFHPTGEFQNVKELENLLISSPGDKSLLYLKDVAKVSRGFQEVPTHLVSLNGRQAISLGISFASGFNVVDVGKSIDARLTELEYARPVGIELAVLYDQPKLVNASIKAFAINLLEAVVIVIVVLLLFMGVRSGLLIGLILFLTVVGSFVFMKLHGLELQRISLGALIIALGMLVDNAIVITEGILIGMQRGLNKIDAAKSIVKQTIWPLLGATVIAVTAFAPIGLSNDSTGEMLGSLFYVLLYSLMLSWITAITLTPFFADMILKTEKNGDASDPYQGAFYIAYKGALDACLKHKSITAIVTVAMLVASVYGFQQVKVVFFPAMTTPMVLVDYRKEHGTDIRQTFSEIQEIEPWILEQEGVTQVSSNTGKGGMRFMLTYSPEKIFASYGQFMVELEDYRQIDGFIKTLSEHFDTNYPDVNYDYKKFELGPSKDGKIEARFSGPDPDVLRKLAVEAKQIYAQQVNAVGIRDDWKKRTKIIRPQFSEAQARRVGVSKQDLDNVLQMSFSGKQIGLYRDGTTLMPIIARPPEVERKNIDTVHSLQIWSPVHERYIAIEQVVQMFDVEWEDAAIYRRDRKRTITVIANAYLLGEETSNDVFKKIQPEIEAMKLPKGYSLEWGGEFESSGDANKALMGSIPLGVAVMFIITLLLFNTLKQPLVIWSLAPMAIIGVSFGLLVTGSPFTFMALLGFISLVGMLLKNGIVLVDQINLELSEGKQLYHAIFDSAVSRVRPVSMAAATTILGMIPLLFDAFFSSMAVTIMFGLGFATVLTLIVVPVIYAIVYRVEYIPLKK
jgi:multidrug efflux pump subunit AcrB